MVNKNKKKKFKFTQKQLEILSLIAHTILACILCDLVQGVIPHILVILSIGVIGGIQKNCIIYMYSQKSQDDKPEELDSAP